MAVAMIDFESVSFTYDGTSYVLKDVELTIPRGQFLCILGANGSGKSTLAKHINALLLPDKGCVRINGMNTNNPAQLFDIRKMAGMVFQNPDDQLVASLIENDVAFGPENLGLPSDEIRRRVTKALVQVGLHGFETTETAELSGGQKQRVAIAGILAMQPDIIVFDEASSMLDPRGRKGLMRICHELHEAGMTIVMVTHYMEEAAQAERIVVLQKGELYLDGTPNEIFAQAEQLMDLNLEVPFACHLAHDLRQHNFPLEVTPDEGKLVRELADILKENTADRTEDVESDIAVVTTVNGDEALFQKPNQATAPQHDVSTQTALIDFQNVSFTYALPSERKAIQKRTRSKKPLKRAWGVQPDTLWAVSDLSFTVKRGDFLGIAGHTGSGKSTLLQLMNGLLHPQQGKIFVNELDLADKKNAARIRGKVGLVFQSPENQLFAETVFDDVAFGPRNLGYSKAEVEQLVDEALINVGLEPNEFREKSPFALSGGQQRRVAFAGVLAMKPEVLILDEPVAGLDPAAHKEFLTLIKRLHQQGLTIVMVSHDMDDLAKYCTQILVLNKGSKVAEGMPHKVFAQGDALREIGLGLPSPTRFAEALRNRGIELTSGYYDYETLMAALVSRRQS